VIDIFTFTHRVPAVSRQSAFYPVSATKQRTVTPLTLADTDSSMSIASRTTTTSVRHSRASHSSSSLHTDLVMQLFTRLIDDVTQRQLLASEEARRRADEMLAREQLLRDDNNRRELFNAEQSRIATDILIQEHHRRDKQAMDDFYRREQLALERERLFLHDVANREHAAQQHARLLAESEARATMLEQQLLNYSTRATVDSSLNVAPAQKLTPSSRDYVLVNSATPAGPHYSTLQQPSAAVCTQQQSAAVAVRAFTHDDR